MAYGLGLMLCDMVDVALNPYVFTTIFHAMTMPMAGIVDYYKVAFAVSWLNSGLTYLLSVALHQ